jgi:hypothetical protein
MFHRHQGIFRGIRTLLAAAALAWTAVAAPANSVSLARLSPPARALVEKAFQGLDPQAPLEDYHVITTRERRALNEIARVNPLLFDFVLKRSLRDPATGRGLPASVFLANPAMPPTGIIRPDRPPGTTH